MEATLPSLSEVIATHQLSAKKALGQHFLLDVGWLEKIVACAGDLTGKQVLEVGPGPGGLTRALLASHAAHVYAVEKDTRCIAALQSLKAYDAHRFTLLEADALATNIMELLPAPRAIVANLPYNVGTQLVIHWLHALYTHGADAWSIMVVMLQHEVVQRMLAQPGTKAYGRLSVLTQWLCDGDMALFVPPDAFKPPPKVDSAVLRLQPLATPRYPASLALLEKVVAAAFNQRRKMLRVSLKSLGVDAHALCERAGVPPELRADACRVEQFCALAQAMS